MLPSIQEGMPMTDYINIELLELAAQHIDYWAGRGIGPILENDLNADDLEALAKHLLVSLDMINEGIT